MVSTLPSSVCATPVTRADKDVPKASQKGVKHLCQHQRVLVHPISCFEFPFEAGCVHQDMLCLPFQHKPSQVSVAAPSTVNLFSICSLSCTQFVWISYFPLSWRLAGARCCSRWSRWPLWSGMKSSSSSVTAPHSLTCGGCCILYCPLTTSAFRTKPVCCEIDFCSSAWVNKCIEYTAETSALFSH